MKPQEVVNSWEQCVRAGGDRIMICYHAQQPRSVLGSYWSVLRLVNGKEVPTNPKAAWYEYGRKTFPVSGRDEKQQKLVEAIAWVATNYGPREFVRNRMRDMVERDVNERFPVRRTS